MTQPKSRRRPPFLQALAWFIPGLIAVAAAGLATAFFVPDSSRSDPGELIHGIHEAFLALGLFTILSTVVFHTLKSSDGANVSQHKVIAPA